MSLIKVVKKLGGAKQYGIEYTDSPTLESVARVIGSKSGRVEGFITMTSESNEEIIEIDAKLYDNEPLIPMSKQRLAIVISGGSDEGKSTTGAMFTTQYKKMMPKREIYFVSQKRLAVDRNFSKIQGIHQMDSEEIEEFVIDDYSDCLFIIDDSDFGKEKKMVMEMLNLIATVGREYRISFIFITHFNSRLNESQVYKEFQLYVTFHENLVNNRMLEQNMGMTKAKIESLRELKSSFYVFNKIFRVVITENAVVKF